MTIFKCKSTSTDIKRSIYYIIIYWPLENFDSWWQCWHLRRRSTDTESRIGSLHRCNWTPWNARERNDYISIINSTLSAWICIEMYIAKRICIEMYIAKRICIEMYNVQCTLQNEYVLKCTLQSEYILKCTMQCRHI